MNRAAVALRCLLRRTCWTCLLPLLCLPAGATEISVDAFGDDLDLGANGNCTLREAVVAANTNATVDACPAGEAGPAVTDRIVLGAGTYTLSLGPEGDDQALHGDLDVNDEVAIEGAGARSTVIDAANLDRVFEVDGGVVAALSDLAVTGGDAPGNGGGFLNRGTLTLSGLALRGNRADATGGGIRNEGTITIVASTLSGNSAPNDHGGGMDDHGTSTVINTTVSGNSTINGGGLYNLSGTQMTLDNVTLTGNIATGSGSALVNDGTTTVTNTLIDGGCNAPVATTAGGNLESPGDTCGLGGADLVAVVDPGLGALAANGGNTDTHALLAGSPALDAGTPVCPGIDQRGRPRPLDGDGDGSADCDIGAFELNPNAGVFADDFETGTTGAWSSGA